MNGITFSNHSVPFYENEKSTFPKYLIKNLIHRDVTILCSNSLENFLFHFVTDLPPNAQ